MTFFLRYLNPLGKEKLSSLAQTIFRTVELPQIDVEVLLLCAVQGAAADLTCILTEITIYRKCSHAMNVRQPSRGTIVDLDRLKANSS